MFTFSSFLRLRQSGSHCIWCRSHRDAAEKQADTGARRGRPFRLDAVRFRRDVSIIFAARTSDSLALFVRFSRIATPGSQESCRETTFGER